MDHSLPMPQNSSQKQPTPAGPQPAGGAWQQKREGALAQQVGRLGDKERETISIPAPEVREITVAEAPPAEVEVTAEIKEIGVEVRPEAPVVPPELQKIGVQPAGPAQPVIHQGGTVTTTMTLPITDDQVVTGLHATLLSSLRWLAEWCIRQLKKAHLVLRKIHGKVVRVRMK